MEKEEENLTSDDFSVFEQLPKPKSSKSLLKFVEDKLKNYPLILHREFKHLENVNEEEAKNKFRIMQWNILARTLCFPDKDSKAPLESFDWSNYRLWRTVQEIVRHDSDIICLEEADKYEEIKLYLHSIGYTSFFCPKYASPCLDFPGNHGPDGLAIFYRLSMFQILNLSCDKITVDNEITSQVFIIMQLLHKPTNKPLTLVCLHLKSKLENFKRREDQIKIILPAVKAHISGNYDDLKTHPLLICGDFNGEPFERFYEVIVNDNELASMRDAYSTFGEKKEPTTIKFKGKDGSLIQRGIDYIFYNQTSLKLNGYLELPCENQLIKNQGLPNLQFSSDHLSLVCDFLFNSIQ